MYPTQCYPNQAQYYNPYLQPQVNAVKIDINNPQAYGGANSQGQINPVAPQQGGQCTPYTYPYAPMYQMPQFQQYEAPATAYPMPPYVMPPVNNNTVQNNTTTPVVPPVPPAPVVMSAPVVNTQPLVSAPVTQQVNVNPSIPAAIVDNKANTTVAPISPVTAQTPETSSLDVNGLLTGLASTNPDMQTAAIQKMAEIAQTDPNAAKSLLNEQTFGQLVNLINSDTRNLPGPKGQSDPKNLSPLEKAEINKQFAVYTLAILQKNFRDEINKEMKKNNLPDIVINDLPYIKEGIVNNLKDNPNPTIREACLSALNYIGRPEDKQVLKVLYEISAKHDANPAVRAVAQDYLTKLPA